MTRRNSNLSDEDNAEIEKRVREGTWRQCPKCEVRLPHDVPCPCDPTALGEFVRASVMQANGICNPCRDGRHIHNVCVPIAGCKCEVVGEEARLPPGVQVGALVITPPLVREIEQVIAYAAEHPYRPAQGDPPPGDFAEHTVQLGPLRCVFSVTEMKRNVVRHLSISIDSRQLPHPITVGQIAPMFGFTGELMEDYFAAKHETEPGVIICFQPMPEPRHFDA